MTLVADIIDEHQLIRDLHLGYIRKQFHPEFPYAILNYTEKAQYENHWTSATLNCRGLIYNVDTDEVVARPFPKFFNYSQLTDPPAPDTKLLSVTDKMDGSLGIIYRGPDFSINVATRGSFASDQALWATQWIQEHPEVYPLHYETMTLLTEIIYAQNRIVLSYGDREGLVLLGGVRIETGIIKSADKIGESRWTGERTEVFSYPTLADVLSAPDRENAEGYVALTKDNELIKFKQEDYIKLHRILTGLTERTVYDVLVSEGNVDRLIEIVPDEFHPWVQEVAERLVDQHDDLILTWMGAYGNVRDELPENCTQKEFALAAVHSAYRAALFVIHSENDTKLDEMAWKQIRPPATMATVAQREQEEAE